VWLVNVLAHSALLVDVSDACRCRTFDLKSCCAFASQVHITCTVVHFMTGARLENSSVCLCCLVSAERRQI
jgi:hypothetical protein